MTFADILAIADSMGTDCFFIGLGFAIVGSVIKFAIRILS